MTLTGIPLGFPVVALCHEDPGALDLQILPLLMVQTFIDDIEVCLCLLIAFILGLDYSWVGQSASLSFSSPPGRALQYGLTCLPIVARTKEHGQFCSHSLRMAPMQPHLQNLGEGDPELTRATHCG